MLPANLLVTCSLMFGGAMLSGVLPMAFTLDPSWLTWIEYVGAGFMIGSAFAVVLPEGFEALYSVAEFETHSHDHRRALMSDDAQHSFDAEQGRSEGLAHDEEQKELQLPVPRWSPGGALLAGFLAMMLFEYLHHRFGGEAHAHGHGHSGGHSHGHSHSLAPDDDHRTAERLESGGWTPTSVLSGDAAGSSAVGSSRAKLRSSSTGPQGSARVEAAHDASLDTQHKSKDNPAARSESSTQAVFAALLVHTAADGLAVGVAHMSDSLRLAIAIGMAMVLHKGPVAFGFVSFLMSRRCDTADIWQKLIIFSLSSPVVAMTTYLALQAATWLTASTSAVALCVLFSAGTFLYAACVHLLPDLSDTTQFTAGKLTALVAGALVPLVFNASAAHHH